MHLCGEHLSVARALAGMFFCVTLLALYGIALLLLDRRRAALFALSLLSLKFLGWPAFSAYTYWDVSFALCCLAILLFLRGPRREPSPQLAAAGLCTGLALLAKQNLGLYLGAACAALIALPAGAPGDRPLTVRRRAAALACFALGAALPVGAMALHFASHGLLGTMLHGGFVRPLTGYLPTSGLSFARMLAWWQLGSLRGADALPYLPVDYWELLMRGHLPAATEPWLWLGGELAVRLLYASVPLAFAWALLRAPRRRGAAPPRERLPAFALLALAVFASALPRADFVHVISVYPPVLLLLLALRRASPRSWRMEAVAVALGLAVCGLLAVHHRSHLSYRMVLERATVEVDPSAGWLEALVETIERELDPGEPLFVLGHEAHLYFLTARFSPWPFSQLYPGQVGGDGGRALAALLEQDPPPLVVQGILHWPGVPDLLGSAPALLRWVRAHYEEDRSFFERHPPAAGPPPNASVVRILRRRPAPAGRAGTGGAPRREPRRAHGVSVGVAEGAQPLAGSAVDHGSGELALGGLEAPAEAAGPAQQLFGDLAGIDRHALARIPVQAEDEGPTVAGLDHLPRPAQEREPLHARDHVRLEERIRMELGHEVARWQRGGTQKAAPAHTGAWRRACQGEERRRDVEQVHGLETALPRAAASAVADHERHAQRLRVEREGVEPAAVLAELLAVVGDDH
jgi:hypothetical protein